MRWTDVHKIGTFHSIYTVLFCNLLLIVFASCVISSVLIGSSPGGRGTPKKIGLGCAAAGL